MLGLAITIAVGSGVLTGVGAVWVLRRLAEPAGDTAAAKLPYRQLATARFGVAAGLLSGTGVLIALLAQPTASWPAWTAFGTVGILLALIDARTTWIPASLTRIGWAVTAAAVVASLVLGGTVQSLLRSAAAGAAVWAFFLLIWFIGRGRFGFGDVRFALIVGLVTGLQSWPQVGAALSFGVVFGAVVGLVQLIIRRRSTLFPYAPALAAGAVMAAIVF